jgi:hypothetical protein
MGRVPTGRVEPWEWVPMGPHVAAYLFGCRTDEIYDSESSSLGGIEVGTPDQVKIVMDGKDKALL